MRWRGRRRSTNVQDRRGARPAVIGGGAAGVVVVILALLFGVDPGIITGGGDAGRPVPGSAAPGAVPPADDAAAGFVAVVLGDTEEVWRRLFDRSGAAYREPTLVLFSGYVESACGLGQAAMGPFYCPMDEQVYIDLSFYEQLRERLGAPGDFAQAYVIAHEVGHHVQNLTGTADRIRSAQRAARSDTEVNQLSVAMELQADCYAGVWAHHQQRMFGVQEEGDVEEALNAAAAIGDDRLQRAGQGYVVPETFTHGTSRQRTRWFRRGLESGEPARCDPSPVGV